MYYVVRRMIMNQLKFSFTIFLLGTVNDCATEKSICLTNDLAIMRMSHHVESKVIFGYSLNF